MNESEREWPREPWRTELYASAQQFYDADGCMFVEPIDFEHDTNTPNRIVACVNACAGIPSDELERVIMSGLRVTAAKGELRINKPRHTSCRTCMGYCPKCGNDNTDET